MKFGYSSYTFHQYMSDGRMSLPLNRIRLRERTRAMIGARTTWAPPLRLTL